MSKDQGKKKTEPQQKHKQIPATKEKQNIKSTELKDAELDNVAGGRAVSDPIRTNWKTGGGTT